MRSHGRYIIIIVIAVVVVVVVGVVVVVVDAFVIAGDGKKACQLHCRLQYKCSSHATCSAAAGRGRIIDGRRRTAPE